ncbi:ABC transporter permease [Mesonia sp.]|uniref:ABC transporter permease n=1 Tax=Mesonia sp. TaxID=1960830 RepID=UPI003F99555D
MSFSYYIAKRYLATKSKNSAINIITIIAGVGVFAGALALFIVLSGFAGLKEFSLSFSNEFDPDLKILPSSGKTIQIDSEQLGKIKQIEGVQAFSKIIEEQVLLSYNNKHTPAFIKSVDKNYLNVNPIENELIGGVWMHPLENQVVIGSLISKKLSLGIGGYNDALKVMVPQPGKGQVSDASDAFSSKSAVVIGVYSINEELNSKYVFAPYFFAEELLQLKKGEFSALELRLKAGVNEESVREELISMLGDDFIIKNRMQLNDKLYKMLNTENLAVYLIFTLVLIIALFNVGGAIVMAILDKQHNIRTLYYLGASAREIKRIFLLQGSLLTFVGGMLGLGLGIVIILLQLQFDLLMITTTLPYPVALKAENVFIVFATIMVLGIMATYMGATRISKVLA